MEENKLDFKAQSNYIVVTEKDNPKNVAQIEYNRTVSILSGSTFSPENLQKIYHMAEHGNMICPGFESFFPHGHLVLTPINRLSKEYLNPETDIVEQFCIETIDGKEYVCTGKGVIVPKLPEDFNDIPHISNPEDKKYMLTNYTKEYDGQTLYRIRALKDFGNVKAGELGGFVSGEHNLSQEGDCWIRNKAIVRENALVKDNACVGLDARIEGNSIISEQSYVGSNSIVSKNAQIKGASVIEGNTYVTDNVILSGTYTDEYVKLYGNARIENVEIGGNITIKTNQHITSQNEIEKLSQVPDSNLESEKYVFTNETKEYDGQTLYRIRALKDFGNVKAGELGGFVSGEHNLSQEGDCWVDYFATVTHNARITDNAIVSGKAVVTDNARITENIIINDNVKIGGDVKLSEYAQIKGFACTDKQEQADGICSQGKTSQSKRLFFKCEYGKIHIYEEGDKAYSAIINSDRKIEITPGKIFTHDNLQKVYDMADSGNMIVSDGKFRNHFALPIIHRIPKKEYVDNIKDEVNQLCIETIDGTEYVCNHRNGEIFPGKPEDYRDIPIIVNPEGKKYILTDYTCQVDGQTLYRIRAVKSFPGVKAGELGGYVAGEHNLSQDGICWIFPKAVVRENALVKDEARVFGKSRLEGNALLEEYARTYDFSHISGNTRIGGSAQASGYSRISGFVRMSGESRAEEYAQLSGSVILTDGARVRDHAKLSGNVQMSGDSIASGFAEITDNVHLHNEVLVYGHAKISGNVRLYDKSSVTEFAELKDNVLMCDESSAYGNARLSGNVQMSEYSCISGYAQAKDNAKLKDDCYVGGNVKLSGDCNISGSAQLYDNVQIRKKGQVSGTAELTGNVCVTENAKIDGYIKLSGDTIVKGNTHISTQEQANKVIKPCISKTSSNEITL